MSRTSAQSVFALLGKAGFALAAGTLCCFASGCATIIWGTTQTIDVRTDPPGADVFVSGKHKGTTPCEIEVPRNRKFLNVVLKKDGYADTRLDLKDRFNPISAPAWALDYCWMFYGIIVDARSDAGFHYVSEVSVPLLTDEDPPECRYLSGGNIILEKAR